MEHLETRSLGEKSRVAGGMQHGDAKSQARVLQILMDSAAMEVATAGGCKGQKATRSMRTWCGYIGEDGWIVANLLRRIVFPSAVDGIGHLCSHLI